MKWKENDRLSLIVCLYSFHKAHLFKRLGDVEYISPKMNYFILSINKNQEHQIKNKLEKNHLVKAVYISYLPRLSAQLTAKTIANN